MANTALKVAVLATGLGAGGLAAWYLYSLLTQHSGEGIATACFENPSGASCMPSMTYFVGDTVRLEVSVPSTYDPVSVQVFVNGTGAIIHPWTPSTQGYTYTVDFGTAAGAGGPWTVYALVTFSDNSTTQSNNCTLQVNAVGTCSTGEVACYCSGSLEGCCPSGELCVDCASGLCPSGSTPDPNNPGCCQQAGILIPASYNGPNPVYITNDICQPVYDDLFNGWTCCGTPVVTQNQTQITIQVLDQNGLPLTGVDVQVATTGNFYADRSDYTTDSKGQIYPILTSTQNPTSCEPPSSSGDTQCGSGTIVAYVVGYPPPTYASYQATIDLDCNYSYNTANDGLSCGGC